jgi:hypothetical protein
MGAPSRTTTAVPSPLRRTSAVVETDDPGDRLAVEDDERGGDPVVGRDGAVGDVAVVMSRL